MNHPDNLLVHTSRYKYGNHLRIELVTPKGESYAVLSLNIPEHPRGKHEFIVKNYSENEGLDQLSRYGGLFEDTGKTVFIGWGHCPIWRMVKTPDQHSTWSPKA